VHNPELQDLVTSIGDLATLPHTVVQLLDLLKDSTCSATKVVKVLERDPAMTANILKLSNSAFYGSRREISNVRDALVMLGNRSVVTLAFATGMAPVMRRDLTGYGLTRERFWGHSVKAATASAIAAERLGLDHLRCEAFTAGLVHDVGMLVVDVHLEKTGVTLDPSAPNFCASDAEREALGFDHNEAGAMLARHWGFPDSLAHPIEFHHDPEVSGPHQDIVRCVAAGNILAQVVDEDLDPQANDYVRQTLANLRFDESLLEKLRVDLTCNLEETLSRATRPSLSRV
jgi:HD-like signal output (HDOD) protein